ncbi:MAG: hypothetical protein Q9164_001045 [Protoblastenia rupestris]
MLSLRSRYVFIPMILSLAALTLISLRLSFGPLSRPPPPEEPKAKQHPIYKPPKSPPPPPLPEYFPLAASASSPADLPPIPSWNRPPDPHVPEKTRLYIGFTRYWPLLQQVVVSYITAGWPPSDIYVVENTGTFDANKRGLLTSSNPFYMDYRRLIQVLGVNVITMPSLQSFAQLQNFYLSEAINNNLSYYFWGHMDVVLTPHESQSSYRSLYQIAVDTIRESQSRDFERNPDTGEQKMWAIRFFAYDWFALVNAEAFQKIGGWDSMVSYYGTDCDMHSRIAMNDMTTPIADAADVFDVGSSLEDLEVLYRRRRIRGGRRSAAAAAASKEKRKEDEDSVSRSSFTNTSTTAINKPASPEILKYLEETEEDERGGPDWHALTEKLESMAQAKREDPYRNSWQLKQRGGQGEPYYYDADGWEKALQMTIDTGLKINEEKWGHRGCDIRGAGLKEGDQWMVEHDW